MPNKIDFGLKGDWMKIPAKYFEPLTFGELKVGQKFIGLPIPGDNEGYGGLRDAHYIFTKTNYEKAVNNKGISRDFPDSMPVILVE